MKHIIYKENLDNSTIDIASHMISKHSRGEDYPISPREELKQCEHTMMSIGWEQINWFLMSK